MKISEIIQLTEEDAVEFYNSNKWKSMTDLQKVKFQLFQDRLCMPFGEFQSAMTRVLERPIFTHEFADRDGLTKEFENKIQNYQ